MFDLLLEYWYLTTNGSIVYHHCEVNDEFVKGHLLVNENVVVVVEIKDLIMMNDVQQDDSNTMDVMVVEVVEVIVLENVLVEVVVEVLEDDDDEHEDDDDAMDEKDDEVKPKVSIEMSYCWSLVNSVMMNE